MNREKKDGQGEKERGDGEGKGGDESGREGEKRRERGGRKVKTYSNRCGSEVSDSKGMERVREAKGEVSSYKLGYCRVA